MSLRVIDPRDNVAVQIGEGGAVPSGHKVARRAIAQGEFVIKYGEIIGRATQDIAPGEWVHTHNLATRLDGAGAPSAPTWTRAPSITTSFSLSPCRPGRGAFGATRGPGGTWASATRFTFCPQWGV